MWKESQEKLQPVLIRLVEIILTGEMIMEHAILTTSVKAMVNTSMKMRVQTESVLTLAKVARLQLVYAVAAVLQELTLRLKNRVRDDGEPFEICRDCPRSVGQWKRQDAGKKGRNSECDAQRNESWPRIVLLRRKQNPTRVFGVNGFYRCARDKSITNAPVVARHQKTSTTCAEAKPTVLMDSQKCSNQKLSC